MAQLTWRNVDAPNFSGVTDALRVAGQNLTAGLSAGRDAIDDFQKGQTTAESARLLAAAAAEKDPAKLPGIIAGFDPRYISPDAMKTVLARPQDLATLDSTKASTDSTRVTTAFNEKMNPLKVEEGGLIVAGKKIANASAGVALNQDIWKNEVARKEKEATQPYLQDLARFRQLKGSTDPAAQAEAATLLPGLSAKAAAAGVTDLNSVLNSGDTAAANAVKLKTDWLGMDKTQRAADLDNRSNAIVKNLIDTAGSPAGAQGLVDRDTDMEPTLRAEVAKKIGAARSSYVTPNQSEILAATAGQAAAQTQPAAIPTEPRAKLNFFTSAAKAAGLEVTSDFRDENHPLTKANPNSAHAKAQAWDLRARTPEQGDAVMAKQREVFTKMGMQEGRDYKIIDEVRSPAGHATGPHIHVQLTGEGEARQRTAQAAQGGDRAREMVTRAVADAAPRSFAAPAPAQTQAPVETGVDLRTPQGLATNEQTISTMLNSVKSQTTMDGSMDPTAAITDAFAKPKDSKSTALQVATQLHKDSGGDKDNGGIFSRDKLTVGNINEAVQAVIRDYKVSPDLAGVLVSSAIQTTQPFLPIVGSGGRRLDVAQVKNYIDRYVTTDGKPKPELLTIQNQKASISKQADEAQALLQKAKEEWLGAEGAARNGNTRVNVDAARERYAQAQRAADAMVRKLAANPNVLGNSATNTKK